MILNQVNFRNIKKITEFNPKPNLQLESETLPITDNHPFITQSKISKTTLKKSLKKIPIKTTPNKFKLNKFLFKNQSSEKKSNERKNSNSYFLSNINDTISYLQNPTKNNFFYPKELPTNYYFNTINYNNNFNNSSRRGSNSQINRNSHGIVSFTRGLIRRKNYSGCLSIKSSKKKVKSLNCKYYNNINFPTLLKLQKVEIANHRIKQLSKSLNARSEKHLINRFSLYKSKSNYHIFEKLNEKIIQKICESKLNKIEDEETLKKPNKTENELTLKKSKSEIKDTKYREKDILNIKIMFKSKTNSINDFVEKSRFLIRQKYHLYNKKKKYFKEKENQFKSKDESFLLTLKINALKYVLDYFKTHEVNNNIHLLQQVINRNKVKNDELLTVIRELREKINSLNHGIKKHQYKQLKIDNWFHLTNKIKKIMPYTKDNSNFQIDENLDENENLSTKEKIKLISFGEINKRFQILENNILLLISEYDNTKEELIKIKQEKLNINNDLEVENNYIISDIKEKIAIKAGLEKIYSNLLIDRNNIFRQNKLNKINEKDTAKKDFGVLYEQLGSIFNNLFKEFSKWNWEKYSNDFYVFDFRNYYFKIHKKIYQKQNFNKSIDKKSLINKKIKENSLIILKILEKILINLYQYNNTQKENVGSKTYKEILSKVYKIKYREKIEKYHEDEKKKHEKMQEIINTKDNKIYFIPYKKIHEPFEFKKQIQKNITKKSNSQTNKKLETINGLDIDKEQNETIKEINKDKKLKKYINKKNNSMNFSVSNSSFDEYNELFF